MALRPALGNLALLVSTLLLLFLVLEVGMRMIAPYPYYSPVEIGRTKHSNITMYDSLLGWRGVPNCKEWFTTANSRTLVEHNRFGFRDMEHVDESLRSEAIVFLGDSYAWGYEVNFDQMFVNLLRDVAYDIYNLSHRGYGTDQAFLTFKQWQYPGRIRLVILMFYDNDFVENNTTVAGNVERGNRSSSQLGTAWC